MQMDTEQRMDLGILRQTPTIETVRPTDEAGDSSRATRPAHEMVRALAILLV